ncbi:TetR/AcrR family transcriptional regulator [Leucobacter soli]|uniref:TetR/AcrR family transcriptional regulator n=1 Tax=Leucobacter soli TaxID=2812850 RepID=UPI00361037F8
MARPKRQGERRQQLARAAQRVIAQYGLNGAKLSRIASEAGLTSGAVLYYYPDIEELVLEAINLSMHRFSEERARMLEALDDDPALRLVRMIEAGLPVDGDDVEVRLFCQLGERQDPTCSPLPCSPRCTTDRSASTRSSWSRVARAASSRRRVRCWRRRGTSSRWRMPTATGSSPGTGRSIVAPPSNSCSRTRAR